MEAPAPCCSADAICPACAEESAFVATADMMRPTSPDDFYITFCITITCDVCEARFRAWSEHDRLCGECQRYEEIAQESEGEATLLAVRAEQAGARAREDRRVAGMTPDERDAYWAAVQAEDDHMQDVLL